MAYRYTHSTKTVKRVTTESYGNGLMPSEFGSHQYHYEDVDFADIAAQADQAAMDALEGELDMDGDSDLSDLDVGSGSDFDSDSDSDLSEESDAEDHETDGEAHEEADSEVDSDDGDSSSSSSSEDEEGDEDVSEAAEPNGDDDAEEFSDSGEEASNVADGDQDMDDEEYGQFEENDGSYPKMTADQPTGPFVGTAPYYDHARLNQLYGAGLLLPGFIDPHRTPHLGQAYDPIDFGPVIDLREGAAGRNTSSGPTSAPDQMAGPRGSKTRQKGSGRKAARKASKRSKTKGGRVSKKTTSSGHKSRLKGISGARSRMPKPRAIPGRTPQGRYFETLLQDFRSGAVLVPQGLEHVMFPSQQAAVQPPPQQQAPLAPMTLQQTPTAETSLAASESYRMPTWERGWINADASRSQNDVLPSLTALETAVRAHAQEHQSRNTVRARAQHQYGQSEPRSAWTLLAEAHERPSADDWDSEGDDDRF